MRGGFVIGIPLTMLQLGIHSHTGAVVDPWTIANNFAVCSAVYDADRIEAPRWSRERLVTRIAAVASTSFYASEPSTAALALLVPPLHLYYADAKPFIAPAKPFVVAALWTACVYCVPLWRTGTGTWDANVCAALFLSISALSHAVDIVDCDDDRTEGIFTPAVLLGPCAAQEYAVGLAAASVLLDVTSSSPTPLYDVLSFVATCGIALERSSEASALVVGFLLYYAGSHDYEIMRQVLRNSETTHRLAIQYSTSAVEYALTLNEPWRSAIIEPLMFAVKAGDAVGHSVLEMYEDTIRGEMFKR